MIDLVKMWIVHDVLKTAEEEWSKDVVDTSRSKSSLERINAYIRDGLDWTWVDYKKNGQFAWCGAFAAYCFMKAGLHPEIRKYAMSSTDRINNWAQYERPSSKWDGELILIPRHPVTTALEPFVGMTLETGKFHFDIGAERVRSKNALDAEPGDIVLVGKDKHGSHITIFRDWDEEGNLKLWEGNATGIGPDGTKREGVIKRTRKQTEVRRVVRLSWMDIVSEVTYS